MSHYVYFISYHATGSNTIGNCEVFLREPIVSYSDVGHAEALVEADHQRRKTGVEGPFLITNFIPLGAPSRVVEARWIDDENLSIVVDGEEVAAFNHDEHGSAGMDAAIRSARAVAEALRVKMSD